MTDAAQTPTPSAPTPPAPTPPDKHTPPEGTPLASTRPPTWTEVIYKLSAEVSRRGLRFAISFMMFKLQLVGKLTPEVALAMTACALGIESAIVAWKEKRLPAAVGLTAMPFVVAGLGALAQNSTLLSLSSYIAMILPAAGGVLVRYRAG